MNQTENFIVVIRNLLDKQKLVTELIHKQEMPRHELVETLVQKQNLTELTKFCQKLDNHELAKMGGWC